MGGIYTLFGLQQSRAQAPRSNFAFFHKTSSRSCGIPNAAGSLSVSAFSTQPFCFVPFCFVLFCCVLFCPVRFCSVLFRVRQQTAENENVLFCLAEKTAFCFVFSATPETDEKIRIKKKPKFSYIHINAKNKQKIRNTAEWIPYQFGGLSRQNGFHINSVFLGPPGS